MSDYSYEDDFVEWIKQNRSRLQTEQQCGAFVNQWYTKLLDQDKDTYAENLIHLFVDDAGINIFPYLNEIYRSQFRYTDFSKFYGSISLSNCSAIGHRGFIYSNIKNINEGNKITFIDDMAFFKCTELEMLDLPNVEIVKSPFCECTNLHTLNFPKCKEFGVLLSNNDKLTRIYLKSLEVTSLNRYDEAYNLVDLYLPSCKKLKIRGDESSIIKAGAFKNLNLLTINKDVDNKQVLDELQKNRPKLKINYV